MLASNVTTINKLFYDTADWQFYLCDVIIYLLL